MGILSQIAEGATRLPAWQSDAARRILVKGDVNETDHEELIALIKKANGIEDPNKPALPPKTLKMSDVPSTVDSQNVAIIKAIRQVKNVNALAQEQILEFGDRGVTVFYGDNASGKSGYCRVLKKACRARGQIEDILPDIYKAQIPSAVAEALFDITIGDKDYSERRVDNSPSPDVLSTIAVFDSESARFEVNERNELIYTPYGLDVFTKLGELCKTLKELLNKELITIDPLPKILADITPTTTVGQLLKSLSYKTDATEVEKLANLSQSELERLQELRKLLAQIEANQPEVLAAQQRRLKSRIEKIMVAVIALDKGLSAEKLSSLRLLQTRALQAAETASLASEEIFLKQPLQGVGSRFWKDMFDAARRYSETIAYPDKNFPVTDEGSRCVLCQQLLEEEAKQRMRSFETFIKQETAKQAEVAEATLKQEWEDFSGLEAHQGPDYSEIIEEIGEDDPDCKKALLEHFASTKEAVARIRQYFENNKWGEIPTLKPSPALRLQALAESKETKAKQLDATTQTLDREGLKKEFDELNARKALHDHKDFVVNYLDKQVHNHRIKQCINDTDTRAISLLGRDITNKAVTKTLQDYLNEELNFLGLDIKLRLVQETREGTTSHYLKLDAVTQKDIVISSVLSEGEQRAAAIASFIAEVRRASHRCGLVFDDPVSSLDHNWRYRVAKRLVKEGANRQIIIFTHDILFLFAIQKECAEQGICNCINNIWCGQDGKGMCSTDDMPWIAMKVQKRVNHLDSRYREAEKEHKANEKEKYSRITKECYELLRECWERAVEELLFNEVVQRFDTDVKTQSLKGVTVTDDDYLRVYYAMKKCSENTHDMPAAVNKPIPKPDELRQDIESLRDFVKETKKRRNELGEQRGKLLQAPTPETS